MLSELIRQERKSPEQFEEAKQQEGQERCSDKSNDSMDENIPMERKEHSPASVKAQRSKLIPNHEGPLEPDAEMGEGES